MSNLLLVMLSEDTHKSGLHWNDHIIHKKTIQKQETIVSQVTQQK